MGGFSRRCSKLINSCESLEAEPEPLVGAVPKTGAGLLAVSSGEVLSAGRQFPGEPEAAW